MATAGWDNPRPSQLGGSWLTRDAADGSVSENMSMEDDRIRLGWSVSLSGVPLPTVERLLAFVSDRIRQAILGFEDDGYAFVWPEVPRP